MYVFTDTGEALPTDRMGQFFIDVDGAIAVKFGEERRRPIEWRASEEHPVEDPPTDEPPADDPPSDAPPTNTGAIQASDLAQALTDAMPGDLLRVAGDISGLSLTGVVTEDVVVESATESQRASLGNVNLSDVSGITFLNIACQNFHAENGSYVDLLNSLSDGAGARMAVQFENMDYCEIMFNDIVNGAENGLLFSNGLGAMLVNNQIDRIKKDFMKVNGLRDFEIVGNRAGRTPAGATILYDPGTAPHNDFIQVRSDCFSGRIAGNVAQINPDSPNATMQGVHMNTVEKVNQAIVAMHDVVFEDNIFNIGNLNGINLGASVGTSVGRFNTMLDPREGDKKYQTKISGLPLENNNIQTSRRGVAGDGWTGGFQVHNEADRDGNHSARVMGWDAPKFAATEADMTPLPDGLAAGKGARFGRVLGVYRGETVTVRV